MNGVIDNGTMRNWPVAFSPFTIRRDDNDKWHHDDNKEIYGKMYKNKIYLYRNTWMKYRCVSTIYYTIW